MKAIILAGGEGRRLRPYTTIFPKPLMPIVDRPILELIVMQLKNAGFTDLTFAVGYLAGLIESYFGDGSRFGVSIDYSLEETPLGTAGPMSLLEKPDDDFLVMNGDILTDLKYDEFMKAHKASGAVATVAVFKKQVSISLGVLEMDDANRVTHYKEKPTLDYQVSTGIYCFKPAILDFLEKGQRCDLPELILRLIDRKEQVYGYPLEGQWLDIGRPEDYEAAVQLVADVDAESA